MWANVAEGRHLTQGSPPDKGRSWAASESKPWTGLQLAKTTPTRRAFTFYEDGLPLLRDAAAARSTRGAP